MKQEIYPGAKKCPRLVLQRKSKKGKSLKQLNPETGALMPSLANGKLGQITVISPQNEAITTS